MENCLVDADIDAIATELLNALDRTAQLASKMISDLETRCGTLARLRSPERASKGFRE